MGLNEWLGIISVLGVIGTVVSLWIALSERRTRKELQNYIRTQNWFLYGKASNTNGHVQNALKRYVELAKDTADPLMLVLLSQADAFGQDVLKDTVRLIQYSEPTFDGETVKRWANEGRIQKGHNQLFYIVTPAYEPLPIDPPEATESQPT